MVGKMTEVLLHHQVPKLLALAVSPGVFGGRSEKHFKIPA
jgi:hypothetical protein